MSDRIGERHEKNSGRSGKGSDRKRSSSYRDVAFRERHSSGRPGSPHRYFETSHDVTFSDGASPAERREQTISAGERPDQQWKSSQASIFDADELSGNHQAVHRHANGLCIVTAGNVLENLISGSGEIGEPKIVISSIRYLVKVSEDSQSARGKMRTKNKKRKHASGVGGGETSQSGGQDGRVAPLDPLCRITLSDGREIELRCCVEGTIIELNRRLCPDRDVADLAEVKRDDRTIHTAEKMFSEGDDGLDSSVLLSDPLLDGHLSIIMPTRGAFPPKEK